MINALMSDVLADDQLRGIVAYDIAPVAYEHSHRQNVLALMDLDLSAIESRADADQRLHGFIPDNATRLFLLQSLARENDKFYWKLNLPILSSHMNDIVGFPSALVADKQCVKPALFLYGGDSNFVEPKHHDAVRKFFPLAQLEKIEGASHWIHIDKRDKLVQSTKRFLKQLSVY